MTGDRPVRIANCSGFFGDRLSAAREQLDGGPIDVLTGDWLAELTMLILARTRRGRPELGWARTFLTQLEDVLGECLERGIRIVSNAGGLNPRGCAEAVEELAARLGLTPTVAAVTGDDLMPRIDELMRSGCDLANLDTGEQLAEGAARLLTANAYTGGWGIAEALRRGADVVVTGRVTDAAVAVGPAAWWFGWGPGDWDRLAGAVVAGHVIECGPQATGGNYSFFTEIPGMTRCGYPIAEVAADGSSVITKHPGTGGAVTVGTVTAQLLYEIGSPRYHNPDVTARFDTIRLTQEAPDRVRISDVRGEPPPPTLKAGLNYLGGFRNTVSLALTGLDVDAKAELALDTLWSSIPGGRDSFDEVHVELIRSGRDDPPSNAEAVSTLRVTVVDADEKRVGRAFTNAVVEMVLAGYPGMFTGAPPRDGTPFGVFWPAAVPSHLVPQTVVVDGEEIEVPSTMSGPPPDIPSPAAPAQMDQPEGETVRAPLGLVVGARSGDKGGNANLGVWARDEAAYAWLDAFLTVDRIRTLLPEAAGLVIERHPLPNILAVNFVLAGLLGRGVAASTRIDPQAKGLGEYLRAKVVDIPVRLLPGSAKER